MGRLDCIGELFLAIPIGSAKLLEELLLLKSSCGSFCYLELLHNALCVSGVLLEATLSCCDQAPSICNLEF